MTSIFGCTPSRVLLPSAADTVEVKVAHFFERLFALWISAFAAFAFLGALFLAVLRLISWSSAGYVYLGITGITLLLAALVYVSRTREKV